MNESAMNESPMNESLDNEIIHRWQGGQSQRGIAADLSLSRWRVCQTIRRRQAACAEGAVDASNSALPAPRGQRSSKLDAFASAIDQLLARYPHITAMRVFEELQRQGYTGGYTMVRQRVRKLRGRPSKPLVVRFETAPGAQAQMDWAEYQIDFTQEGRRRVNLFSYLLGYSRRQYRLLYRAAGLRDHDSRTHPGLPASGRSGGPMPVRQHEGGGHALGRRASRLQHPLPVLRHTLRLPALGLPPAASPNQRQSRTAVPLCGNEPAQRPQLPQSGALERSRPVVVGQRGRRAHASHYPKAAPRRARRGTTALAAASRA